MSKWKKKFYRCAVCGEIREMKRPPREYWQGLIFCRCKKCRAGTNHRKVKEPNT